MGTNSYFTKLFASLDRTRSSLSSALKSLISRGISSEDILELESLFLGADMGIQTTEDIIQWLKELQVSKNNPSKLTEHLAALLGDGSASKLELGNKSTVFLIVGVNGTGKTTTAAKLAYYLKRMNDAVILIGADTYRAAAIQQLEKWSEMAEVRLICNPDAKDPSSIIFDGLKAAQAKNYRYVVVDTAGRLHTYKNLMSEVEKMHRVIRTKFSDFTFMTYLTLDANLGQNSLIQAQKFNQYIPIDGIILTKMDGTAKGGIVFPIYRELGIPVVFLGIGESLTDFVEFNPKEYVLSLLGLENES